MYKNKNIKIYPIEKIVLQLIVIKKSTHGCVEIRRVQLMSARRARARILKFQNI